MQTGCLQLLLKCVCVCVRAQRCFLSNWSNIKGHKFTMQQKRCGNLRHCFFAAKVFAVPSRIWLLADSAYSLD